MIPTLRMLTLDAGELEQRASELDEALRAIGDARLRIDRTTSFSKAGGGALPLLELPSKCLRIQIQGVSANTLERSMRENEPPIIGRLEDDAFIMDLRTLRDDEIRIIQSAFENFLKRVRT
jgi:L-seryl-tRNA(Ser) seleniumtransferase